MLPFILIAAGLGVLLSMVMNARLAKRQAGVQQGLAQNSAAQEEAVAAVRQQAEEAQAAATASAQQVESLASQEPLVRDVRRRMDGVESRFEQFEDRLASAARRSLEGEERAQKAVDATTSTLAALQEEAKSLGAAVQSLRNTSDQRLAEFAARLEALESDRAAPTSPKTTAAVRASVPPPVAKPEKEREATPASDVISSMAAPSMIASKRPSDSTTTSEPSDPVAAHVDDETLDEIDEGSAKWIFVVLGLMLALALIANLAG